MNRQFFSPNHSMFLSIEPKYRRPLADGVTTIALIDTITQANISIMGIPEEKREKGIEKYFLNK